MSLKITCSECGQDLKHVCNADFKSALVSLFRFDMEGGELGTAELTDAFKKTPFYEEGDEKAPFFSEAFLYNLVGKEDARTILGLIEHLARAAGVDPYQAEAEACRAEETT